MPRSGRGGARQGQVGSLYPNRSDLRAAVPVATAPGQTYGERTAQQAAQKAVPVSQPAGPATGAPVPTSSPNPAPELPTAPATPQGPMPGEMPFLHPTQRPGEPLTAGLPRGPGPGPEVLQGIGAVASQMGNEAASAKALLSALAGQPGASSTIRDLAGTAGAVLPRG